MKSVSHKEQLEYLVLKFRNWLSDNYSKKDIEQNLYDDAGYPHWAEIENWFESLLNKGEYGQLDNNDKINLLYLIARNWDIGSMINWLSKDKPLSNLGEFGTFEFIDLAKQVVNLKSAEFDDAKVQIVGSFKKFDTLTGEIENVLLKFYEDKNIDIRGRALLTLGKFRHPRILELLENLWQIDDEFNKIKCLTLIDEYIGNRNLMILYLNDAETKKQEHLNEYVKQLKRKYK
jgi:hypothetical protein